VNPRSQRAVLAAVLVALVALVVIGALLTR